MTSAREHAKPHGTEEAKGADGCGQHVKDVSWSFAENTTGEHTEPMGCLNLFCFLREEIWYSSVGTDWVLRAIRGWSRSIPSFPSRDSTVPFLCVWEMVHIDLTVLVNRSILAFSAATSASSCSAAAAMVSLYTCVRASTKSKNNRSARVRRSFEIYK